MNDGKDMTIEEIIEKRNFYRNRRKELIYLIWPEGLTESMSKLDNLAYQWGYWDAVLTMRVEAERKKKRSKSK
jgi:hypothetical protein